MRRRVALALLVALVAAAPASTALAQPAGRFTFAVLGDTPYFPFEEIAVARILGGLRDEGVAFAIHVGDIKQGSAPCTEEVFAARRALLDAASVPVVFVPGDNDWTDCHRAAAGGYDPVERLAQLRRTFFADAQRLAPPMRDFVRQSADPRFAAYVENVRWHAGGVVFVTLNVPGANNNLGRDAAMDTEHAGRMGANLEWLDQAVKHAEKPGAIGLVVLAHGDPRFEQPPRRVDGYRSFRAVLATHAAWLRKPMLLVHGDGHRYRVDQPLRERATGVAIDSFTRVEVFGSPAVNWVRIDADPADPRVFIVAPGIATSVSQ